jgi:hypothetical protein
MMTTDSSDKRKDNTKDPLVFGAKQYFDRVESCIQWANLAKSNRNYAQWYQATRSYYNLVCFYIDEKIAAEIDVEVKLISKILWSYELVSTRRSINEIDLLNYSKKIDSLLENVENKLYQASNRILLKAGKMSQDEDDDDAIKGSE